MPKRGPDEPVTGDALDTVSAAPRPTRLSLQIAQGRVDRGFVGRAHFRRDLEAAEAEQHGHRLWSPKRQIETGNPIRPGPAQRDTARRVAALEHGAELLATDHTVQRQRDRTRGDPPRRAVSPRPL